MSAGHRCERALGDSEVTAAPGPLQLAVEPKGVGGVGLGERRAGQAKAVPREPGQVLVKAPAVHRQPGLWGARAKPTDASVRTALALSWRATSRSAWADALASASSSPPNPVTRLPPVARSIIG